MREKSSLFLRIIRPDGTRTYAKPVFGSNRHLRPLYALAGGKPELHPEGIYYLRYTAHNKRSWRRIGPSAAEAKTAMERQNHALKGLAIGITNPELLPKPLATESMDTGSPVRVTWAEAAHKYILEIEARKRKRTGTAYRAALEEFADVCPVTYLDEITRDHLLKFEASIRSKGNGARTAFNRVTQVCTFLAKFGLTPLKKGDLPKYTEKVPDAYGVEEIKVLLSAAGPEDRLIFETFLGSGLREQEMMFLHRHDLDAAHGLLQIREKLDVGFEIKDHEERDVPIPDSLVRKLAAHRDAHPGQRFMFQSSRGNPDGHLLRRVKRLALQAGLNCGRCVSRKGLHCSEHPTCERWDLHKFRRTFATWHHDAGVSARTLMAWLGHADFETTLRYLAVADKHSAATRAAVNKTFSVLAA